MDLDHDLDELCDHCDHCDPNPPHGSNSDEEMDVDDNDPAP